MKQATHAEVFEQILFSCEEMCYSVALALTGNRNDARHLEREILKWVWNLLDSEDGKIEIKRKLIKVVHNRFLKDNQRDCGEMDYEEMDYNQVNRDRMNCE